MVILLEDSETPTSQERPETSAVPDEKKKHPKHSQEPATQIQLSLPC